MNGVKGKGSTAAFLYPFQPGAGPNPFTVFTVLTSNSSQILLFRQVLLILHERRM